MKKIQFLLLGLLVLMGRQAAAYSFAGSDWLYSASGQSVAVLNPAFGGTTQTVPINESNLPITVTQPSANFFTFPFALGPFSGTGDFAVTGTTVTDNNSAGTTAPFTIEGQTARIVYPAFTVTGTVTGINPQVLGSFGERAFQITGNPFNIPNATLQVQVGIFWVPAGTVNTTISTWSMVRPTGNPVITGTFNFGQLGQFNYYVGNLPTTLPVSIRNSANAEVSVAMGTYNPVNGAFSVTLPIGSPTAFRISVKLDPWLRRTFPTATNAPFGFTNQDLQLVNFETGDIDGDNEITNADYSIWAFNNGSMGTFAEGDLDGDGDITNADYSIWAFNNGLLGDN